MLKSVLVATVCAAMLWQPANAQEFPTKPLTSIGPFVAGGGADIILRLLADNMRGRLGKPVIHVNKPGAGGTAAGAAILASTPDGHVFGALPPSGAVPEVFRFFSEANYTSQDLEPVARIVVFPLALFVPSKSPIKSLPDFFLAAKADPSLTVAHAGRGHFFYILLAALMKKHAFAVRDIPTSGGGEIITQLLGGHVGSGIASTSAGRKYVESGDLRMLAVQHTERLAWAPNVPTFVELGEDFGFAPNYLSVFVRKGAPTAAIERLRTAIRESLADPQIADAAEKVGVVIDYGDSEAVRQDLAADRKVLGEILRGLGMWKD